MDKIEGDWFEKLSSKNFPKDNPQAASDITTLRVAGGTPSSNGHLRHRCHIQILPSLSPGNFKEGRRLTLIVLFLVLDLKLEPSPSGSSLCPA